MKLFSDLQVMLKLWFENFSVNFLPFQIIKNFLFLILVAFFSMQNFQKHKNELKITEKRKKSLNKLDCLKKKNTKQSWILWYQYFYSRCLTSINFNTSNFFWCFFINLAYSSLLKHMYKKKKNTNQRIKRKKLFNFTYF